MFGNTLTSKQIKKLVAENTLSIHAFDASRLSTVHYSLYARRVFDEDGVSLMADFLKIHEFECQPKKYYLVEADTLIACPPGIVGRFVAPSVLIDAGIALNAGRIDWPYGQKGEPIQFGIYNLKSSATILTSTTKFAHVEFCDLRGLEQSEFETDPRDFQRWLSRRRRAKDDGPFYD
jgi:deoxycytidine triphosphate deaminase